MIRGYVVEYYLEGSNEPHFETVEDATTPLQAVDAIVLSEGEGNVRAAKTHPIH